MNIQALKTSTGQMCGKQQQDWEYVVHILITGLITEEQSCIHCDHIHCCGINCRGVTADSTIGDVSRILAAAWNLLALFSTETRELLITNFFYFLFNIHFCIWNGITREKGGCVFCFVVTNTTIPVTFHAYSSISALRDRLSEVCSSIPTFTRLLCCHTHLLPPPCSALTHTSSLNTQLQHPVFPLVIQPVSLYQAIHLLNTCSWKDSE